MTDEKKLETKDKILKVASELFSRFSFNAVSVRDIAKASGVNVASINYYFQSKENLFWNVVMNCGSDAERGVRAIAESAVSLEDFILKSHAFMFDNLDSIRTNIRIKLTDEVKEPTGDMKEYFESEHEVIGLKYIIEFLDREMDGKVSDEALQFAAESIMGHMIHFAIFSIGVTVNPKVKSHYNKNNAYIIKSLQLHAQAICNYIRENPNL